MTAPEPLSPAFERLARRLRGCAQADEVIFASWRAECSDFVRFNDGRVRQAGTVQRMAIDLKLIQGRRAVRCHATLTGSIEVDDPRIDQSLAMLRDAIRQCEPDPWLAYDGQPAQSYRRSIGSLPLPQQLAAEVCGAAGDDDLVGFWMAGPMAVGLASSLGHNHYHERSSWSFDYSLYTRRAGSRDKAIKRSLAGDDWQAGGLARAIAQARTQLPLLDRPVRSLAPGRYRVLLSPRACADLVAMFNWDGFSARAVFTAQSALGPLVRGERRLDPSIGLLEDLAAADVPRFQADGFMRPEALELVHQGRFAQMLVSPASAREFGAGSNGANASESADALHLLPGTLDEGGQLAALGTGLWISNLWYLNFSDRQTCRITGMTRFACFWVENGVPVAPVEVMRFDDSLFELFGPQLEALGDTSQWFADSDSYDWRGFGGIRAPAALLRSMNFTL